MAHDKYQLLKTLIRADRELSYGDTSHHQDIIIGVVDITSQNHGTEEALAEALFDYLAECFTRHDPEPTPTRSDDKP